MNGSELPKDHGFPIRAIVPGKTSCRGRKGDETKEVGREEGDAPREGGRGRKREERGKWRQKEANGVREEGGTE
jgi:DMSO/TMAO reductase YedYZ molybdopterin-dependent catalytic subunit